MLPFFRRRFIGHLTDGNDAEQVTSLSLVDDVEPLDLLPVELECEGARLLSRSFTLAAPLRTTSAHGWARTTASVNASGCSRRYMPRQRVPLHRHVYSVMGRCNYDIPPVVLSGGTWPDRCCSEPSSARPQTS
jgi:hypothetical protein